MMPNDVDAKRQDGEAGHRRVETQASGCGAKFALDHALTCKKGGLVIGRHDEVKNELADMAIKAYRPSMVRDEPMIHPCRDTPQGPQAENADVQVLNQRKNQERGDIEIRNLWSRGKSCIIDCKVSYLDSKTYKNRPAEKVLEEHEQAKKRKHLQSCVDQRRDFTPFVVSCDGMMGKEADNTLKKLASKLSEKWDRPYSHTCGYLKARMSITVVRATHMCLRGSRIPAKAISYRRMQMEDGAGMVLHGY